MEVFKRGIELLAGFAENNLDYFRNFPVTFQMEPRQIMLLKLLDGIDRLRSDGERDTQRGRKSANCATEGIPQMVECRKWGGNGGGAGGEVDLAKESFHRNVNCTLWLCYNKKI